MQLSILTYFGLMLKYPVRTESTLVLLGVTLSWIFDSIDIMLFALLGNEIGISFGYLPNEWTSKFYLPIFGTQLLFTTIGGLGVGSLGDKLGRKKALVLDIILYAVSSLFLIFTTNVEQFVFARILSGFAIGGMWGLGASLISEVYHGEKRGFVTAIYHSGWPIGVLISALISKVASNLFQSLLGNFWWKGAFALELYSVILIFYIWKYFPDYKNEELGNYNENNNTENKSKENKMESKISPILNIFSKNIIGTTLQALLFATFCMFSFYMVWSLLPNALMSNGYLTQDEKFVFIAFAGIFGISGYVLFGVISDFLGRKQTFSIYALIFSISLIVIQLSLNNRDVLFISLCTTQFSCGFFSSFAGLFSESFPNEIRATASSFSFNGARGIAGILQIAGIVSVFQLLFGTKLITSAILLSFVSILCASMLIWKFDKIENRIKI